MPEAFRLAGDPLGFVRFETTGEDLLDQVSAKAALDLRRGALLGKLEGKHRRAMLQGSEQTLGVDRFFVDTHRQQRERLSARTHRHHVKWACGATPVDPYLQGRGADRGYMDSLRHPAGMPAQAAVSIATA